MPCQLFISKVKISCNCHVMDYPTKEGAFSGGKWELLKYNIIKL